jgi:hypothetical protein
MRFVGTTTLVLALALALVLAIVIEEDDVLVVLATPTPSLSAATDFFDSLERTHHTTNNKPPKTKQIASARRFTIAPRRARWVANTLCAPVSS